MLRGQDGGQKGQNVPISRQIDIMSWKFSVLQSVKLGNYLLCTFHIKHIGTILRVFRGQSGGQKGQNVPSPRKIDIIS